jgi:hypothetical protein
LTSKKRQLRRKNYLILSEKAIIGSKLTRNWILEANQAKNLALQDNFSEMKSYLKKIGSNRRLAAGALSVSVKKPWNYLAELPAEARREAPRRILAQI